MWPPFPPYAQHPQTLLATFNPIDNNTPPHPQVVHEPVEEWQRVPSGDSTLNLLDKFYSDPQKYAYSFQNYVFMSRVMQVCLCGVGGKCHCLNCVA